MTNIKSMECGDATGKRILLGMSGGIDSTYSAVKLRELGFYIEGAILKMSECTDIEAAERSAKALSIPLHIIDCREDFERNVINNFICEYSCARTPNPCIVCNREVKFSRLCGFARENGFDAIATGHYAHILKDAESGRYYISRGKDARKDQSYVLWRLSQEELSMVYFPLADEEKTEIKRLSSGMSLPSADAKESQEICFIPSNDHAAYIEEASGKRFPEGDFIDRNGKVLGKHKGIARYTIGQRKGLGISLGHHAFVTAIDPLKNTVTLGDEEELFSREFDISDIVFQKREIQAGQNARLLVKIRYAAPPVMCDVLLTENGAHVTLDAPARAITSGQSAVFYEGDDVVMGGFIV